MGVLIRILILQKKPYDIKKKPCRGIPYTASSFILYPIYLLMSLEGAFIFGLIKFVEPKKRC